MVYNRQNLQILMFVYGFYCKFQLAETKEASIFALKLNRKGSMHMIKTEDVPDKVLQLRNENVIIDNDVASLYGMGTKEINQL